MWKYDVLLMCVDMFTFVFVFVFVFVLFCLFFFPLHEYNLTPVLEKGFLISGLKMVISFNA